MKAKLIFSFLLTAGMILVLAWAVGAAPLQGQDHPAVVTPRPPTPVPVLPSCLPDSGNGYLPYRSESCQPETTYPERLEAGSFSTGTDQADVVVWQLLQNPAGSTLSGVSMVSGTDGWAVGDAGAIIHWNGTSWQAAASPTTNDLTAVHMVSATDGWAVGSYGTILHWNGSAWQGVASPTGLTLRAVHMASATDGWIVGGDYPSSVVLRWNGAAWSAVSTPAAVYPAILLDVAMVSATDGWAVGNYGRILHWNGSSWQLVASPTNLYIISVDMVSATDGWAVGGQCPNGQIYHWNGISWQVFAAPASNELAAISMVSSTDGWAVSWYGRELLHWDGTSWTKSASPGSARAVEMLSSTDGWAVGGNILHYALFEGLIVHVDNADGQPASGADVAAFPSENYWIYWNGSTDSSGNAYLNVPPGTYDVVAYSRGEHFGLHQPDVASPSTANLTAVGTPVITLTAKKKDGTPLDQAYVNVALWSEQRSYGMALGKVSTDGTMAFNVTSGTYDINVYDTTNYYDLLKRQQILTGPSGTLDFDVSINPTADIVISHPGEYTLGVYLNHPYARVGGTYFSSIAEGGHIVLSANEGYLANQYIQRDATNGDHWNFVLVEDRPDPIVQPGEVITFAVGGALVASGRTEPAKVGDVVVLGKTEDSFSNSLTLIYTTTADGSDFGVVYPLTTLSDPNGVTTTMASSSTRIPYTWPIGWYGVHYVWDTGPYQGLLVADSVFEVKPIATSAVIPTSGGVLTSTFDSISYAFGDSTFTDTVIITHTVRLASIPSIGELVSAGRFFDITAVYSSTGQPAQPTQPYTITIAYVVSDLVIEDTLALYTWDGDQWVKDPSSVVDIQTNTLVATPSHFSLWAVLGEARRAVYLPLVCR